MMLIHKIGGMNLKSQVKSKERVEEQQARDNQESEVSDNAKQEELFDHFGMPVDGE